jgi:conjugative transfer pilus assembly protein TraH
MDSVQDKASDKDKERVMKNINIMWNACPKTGSSTAIRS